jgi:hypothetical protein
MFMSVTLKLNKGTAERLLEFRYVKPEESRNITDKELTLEMNDSDVLIELHPKEKMVEISDFNGSFGIWFKLTKEKVKKFKEIADMGP